MTQSELSEFLSDAPTLFRPEAEKDKISGWVIRYGSNPYLPGLPTYDELMERIEICTDNDRKSKTTRKVTLRKIGNYINVFINSIKKFLNVQAT